MIQHADYPDQKYNADSSSVFAFTQEKLPAMKSLLPYPIFVFSSILALNITAFAVVLQLNMLIFNAPVYKIIAWLVTAGSWTIAYVNRNR